MAIDAGAASPDSPGPQGSRPLRKRNYIAAARNLSRHGLVQGRQALRRAGALGDLGVRALRDPRMAAAVLRERLRAFAREGEDACDTEAVRLVHRRLKGLRAGADRDAPPAPASGKPRLAYVSPLPPDRTGIADYSAALLPELARFYDITPIGPTAAAQGGRSHAWFARHAHRFDRVLYQMGNSPYHAEMIRLLEAFPGTVALHDVFLSDLGAHLQGRPEWRGWWPRELYASHGYAALADFHRGEPGEVLVRRYPSSGFVLRHADGVLVHSAHARTLLEQFYGPLADGAVAIAPFVPGDPPRIDRAAARAALGVGADDFLICSFGSAAPAKLSDRVVEGWAASAAARAGARLALVGAAAPPFAEAVRAPARAAGLEGRLTITGYADPEVYARHLAAADLAIQLRADSRGETSGAVFDALTRGAPAIVNRHGSFDELPDAAVLKLPDAAGAAAVAEAIDVLWADPQRRAALAEAGAAFARRAATPALAAAAYAAQIERFARAPAALPGLTAAARNLDRGPDAALRQARALVGAAPRPGLRTLFVDVSALAVEDLGTGVQRVVRAQLLGLLRRPPAGYRVEPVRIRTCGGAVQLAYARAYATAALGLKGYGLRDAPVAFRPGDVFYMADLSPGAVAQASDGGLFAGMRAAGVRIGVLVHDLLPLQLPDCFPPGAAEQHQRWMEAVAGAADILIGVSAAVADDVRAWLAAQRPGGHAPEVTYLHHGADIEASAPAAGAPRAGRAPGTGGATALTALAERPSFVMVGTVEPRKGYAQALSAFEALWDRDCDINLVIVGAEGWRGLPDPARRDIPETAARLRRHPELGRRLFWLEGASDGDLKQVLGRSTCLLAASYGEGFGLPLIEAAAEGLPILARDIPVFREVAGAYADYFAGETPDALAAAIERWLAGRRTGGRTAAALPRLTWAQNVEQLKALLGLGSD